MVWTYGRLFGSGCGLKWIDSSLAYPFSSLNAFELLKKNSFEASDLEICDKRLEKMARMKARPLQHTTKRKLQERGAREGSRSTSGKRIRLQSPAGQTSSSLEKAKKNKGKNFVLFEPGFKSKVCVSFMELWNGSFAIANASLSLDFTSG